MLLEETLHWLAPERGGLFVDCTLGLGGHAHALLARFPATRLLGIDRDPRALALARERLAGFGGRAHCIEGNFRDLEQLCAEYGWIIDGVTGGGHLKLKHPRIPHRCSHCAKTASDHRTLLNVRAFMRRYAAERLP